MIFTNSSYFFPWYNYLGKSAKIIFVFRMWSFGDSWGIDLFVSVKMNTTVFLGQRNNILFGMFVLLFIDISTKISVECIFAFLSSYNQPLPLNFISKSMTNNISITAGVSYSWVKVEFTTENMFFKDVCFIAVKISKCFSFVLYIGSDKSRIRINFLHNFFSFKIILLWVLVPKMIILNRCSKKQVLPTWTHRSSILHQLSFRHNIGIIIMGNKEYIIIVGTFFQIVQCARFI